MNAPAALDADAVLCQAASGVCGMDDDAVVGTDVVRHQPLGPRKHFDTAGIALEVADLRTVGMKEIMVRLEVQVECLRKGPEAESDRIGVLDGRGSPATEARLFSPGQALWRATVGRHSPDDLEANLGRMLKLFERQRTRRRGCVVQSERAGAGEEKPGARRQGLTVTAHQKQGGDNGQGQPC